MQQIIERLEQILTSIALEDEEIIALQIDKIKSIDHDSSISSILDMLDLNDYSNAVSAIESFISKNTGLIPFVDKEVQGLKLELKGYIRNSQRIIITSGLAI